MSYPQMVRDTNNATVQALYPLTSVALALSGSSSRVALPTDSRVVRIATDVPCYIQFGTSTVTASASSMFFPPGVEVFTCEDDTITHVAGVLSGASPGIFSATKMV
jgi:hypothetical protein